MLPNIVADLNGAKYSEPAWQKAKSIKDMATKTGLAAELIALKAVYLKAKPVLTKLDAGMLPKIKGPDDLKKAKQTAEDTLAGAEVKALIAKLDVVSKKAAAVAKMKLASSTIKAATDISHGLAAIRLALVNEQFTDFDDKLKKMELLYAAQRKDFKPAAQKLKEVLEHLEKNLVVKSIQGTEFSGAFRGFQNKVGNLPEFLDLFDDSLDGLFVERLDFQNKTEEETKKILMKIVTDTRAYMAKVLKRAKEKGY
jgi:hypothetical protein